MYTFCGRDLEMRTYELNETVPEKLDQAFNYDPSIKQDMETVYVGSLKKRRCV
jgi:hypothetical protein